MFFLFYIIYCAENGKDFPTWVSVNFPGICVKLIFIYSVLEKTSLRGTINSDLQ